MTSQLVSNVSISCLQIGVGDTIDVFMPSVEVLSSVLSVSCGAVHTCAVMTNHGVRCWGANTDKMLGNNALNNLATPPSADIVFLPAVAAVSLGRWHTCVLTMQGGARCWGRNFNGQVLNVIPFSR